MAEENAKIKIGFLYNTLYIYDNDSLPLIKGIFESDRIEIKTKSFETYFEKVPNIINLYDFFEKKKDDIEKKWEININNIITDFERGDLPYSEKATFAVALNIALGVSSQKTTVALNDIFAFAWHNITFKNTVNICFKILNEFKKFDEHEMPNVSKIPDFVISKCEFQNDFSLELSNANRYVKIALGENKFKNFSLRFDEIALISFYESIFSGDFKVNTYSESTICGNLKLINCIFNNANLNCKFQDDVYFRDSKFYGSVDFSVAEFKKNVYFNDSEFKNLASFSNCKFQDNVYFNNSEFKNLASFSNCKFQDNVYFNHSKFYGSAVFREAKFEKVASFYGVNFNKVPNFSQAIFKGSLNLVNTNLNFDFTDVKDKINEEYKYRTESEKSMCSYRSKCKVPNFSQAIFKCSLNLVSTQENVANDFRDSFRLFKNALIKDNNLLDASNFHKIELYCKEIELGYKKRNSKDNSKPSLKDELKYWIDKIKSKDWIDLWQLKFYRAISDHHTDLLRSFHSLLMLIGVFVLLSALIIVVFNYYNNAYFEWNLLQNPHSMITFYDTHIRDNILSNSLLFFGGNIALLIVFVALFLFGLFCELFRKVFIMISCFLVIAILAISPKYLILTIEVFTNKREMLDPLSVIGGIYAILFGFMLFSFIKTIRKNSIIPN